MGYVKIHPSCLQTVYAALIAIVSIVVAEYAERELVQRHMPFATLTGMPWAVVRDTAIFGKQQPAIEQAIMQGAHAVYARRWRSSECCARLFASV